MWMPWSDAPAQVVDPMTRRAQRWVVSIPYREPEFTKRTPGAPDEFMITYQVEADTAEDARDEALALFDVSARESSVRWLRKPIHERIIVRPV